MADNTLSEHLRSSLVDYKNYVYFQREQDMRMGDMGVRGAINMGDTYSPAPAGNQGPPPPPPPMMGMNISNRATVSSPSMGPGPALGSEGAASIGAAMMPDNGAVHL
ncbi:unnamed protein product [Ranitomeya imitator]|uniref:Uncharacterized protein n=1 Tax=Ranitomeya imitator TaxID=111125 RepID=A0ABN9L8M3_9NEOB|nr:unnamed protein product [Ranitomeya imitator]